MEGAEISQRKKPRTQALIPQRQEVDREVGYVTVPQC